uniref:Predicted protein n=1 Tax=Physcomitrium patens TaxID=3218 RepID=A9U596_PHYPA
MTYEVPVVIRFTPKTGHMRPHRRKAHEGRRPSHTATVPWMPLSLPFPLLRAGPKPSRLVFQSKAASSFTEEQDSAAHVSMNTSFRMSFRGFRWQTRSRGSRRGAVKGAFMRRQEGSKSNGHTRVEVGIGVIGGGRGTWSLGLQAFFDASFNNFVSQNNEDEEAWAVRRCMRGRSHDWTKGPFTYPGEKARRCNPRRYEDSETACREFRKRELSERRCVRGLPQVGAPWSYDRASRYEDLSYNGPWGRDSLSQSLEHSGSAQWSAGICNVSISDTAVSGVVSKAALTDVLGAGTLVACGSLAEVDNGADIEFVNDGPDGRRAGGAAGFLGEVSGGDSSKEQGMHMDPSIASLFQAFSLSMQQQQSNDRKEALATKALQAVVNKIDQFDRRNILRYLRCYIREMELNQVSEKKMVELFGLATILEIRYHITSITDRYGNSWEVFSHALKNEYFLEDADCVTKKLFLGWIERPNKNLQATKLLREFERQYSQLSKVEKLTLEPNKVDLFLQAADGELQEKLKLLLEDKEEDEGLTTKWKNVEDVVGLLTKKERRKDRSNIPKTIQAPKAPIRTTPPTMPTVQPSTSLSKKADMGMEEIKRGMRDLQIKLARLEENTSINNSKNIALKDREDLLQTNFGKGGMRALVQDYLKDYETVARESASYGARVDDDIGGSTETSEFWAFAVSTMQEGKLPREALLRTTATIRGRTGWEDPVESLLVHAYIAKSQHEALMEEKRRGNFDDTREGNSSKRQTRGDKAREAASQELPVKDTSASLGEKTKERKDKGKSIAYKLLSDIEAATDLKGVLEERILNGKVEFTLKEVLKITKKEFHDIIIDSIKRKRQLMGKTGMSHAIDAKTYRDIEEVDIGYK